MSEDGKRDLSSLAEGAVLVLRKVSGEEGVVAERGGKFSDSSCS